MSNLIQQIVYFKGNNQQEKYVKMKENSFPKSIKLGANSVGWADSDIQDWIESLTKARDLESKPTL